MIKLLRFRFWIATTMAALCGILSLLTIIWPQWIEMVFGVSPDGGDGSLEWLIIILLFVATIVCYLMAAREWRMTRSVLQSRS